MESAPRLRPVSAALGEWIGPRLGPFGGWVGSVVPRGYDAYARVLHPAGDATWAEVCTTTGARPHALMQWTSISRGWSGDQPDTGDTGPDLLQRLVDMLSRFTDGECVLGLWEGYGWVHGGGAVAVITSTRGPAPSKPALTHPPPAYDEATSSAPRLQLPSRNYLTFGGLLAALPTLGDRVEHALFPQSLNLLWPADRSWILGTEIDFDSTLIGGPQSLVDALLAAGGLEAWAVGPDDSLAVDGDTVNR